MTKSKRCQIIYTMIVIVGIASSHQVKGEDIIIGTPVPPSPSPLTSVPPPVVPSVPDIPGPLPFSPGTGLLPEVVGYNNNYYNPASTPYIPILSYTSDHAGDGRYAFSFSTADGKQAEETGFLKDNYIDNAGEPQGTQVVRGSYSYTSPDGTPIQVSYTADENGFRTSGVRIPSDSKAVVRPLAPEIIPTTGPQAGATAEISKDLKNPLNVLNPYNRLDGRGYGAYENYYNQIRPYDPILQYNLRNRFESRHPYDSRNPFDSRNSNGSRYSFDPRYPIEPRRPLDHGYPFDPRQSFDTRYPFDYVNSFDPRHPYDPRHSYDPRRPYEPRHPFDPRQSYNPKNPYQFNAFNTLTTP